MLRADEAFDGDCGLKVGELVLRCHPAPGHSPGSALYFLGETAFFRRFPYTAYTDHSASARE